ncbi:MAG: alpha/beta fold hydrolase, partial [Caldilineaceae bacterium]
EESLARFAEIQRREADEALFAGCESQLLDHGAPVEQVMVMFHGYRNCPRQMQELGQIFYEHGYNVIIPRAPHMGLADPLAPEQAELTADELSYFSTEAVDIAQGLGDRVTVLGISMGGIVTGWQAQSRDDVDLAVLIAPAFGVEVVPALLTTPAVRLFSLLPNQYIWQDNELKTEVPNPPQVYPRNATRPISAFLRYGFAVRNGSRRTAPEAAALLVTTNDADHVVSNETTAVIIERWQGQGFNAIETYHFAADLQLDHDLLSPDHPHEQVEKVYPVLEKLIDEAP